MLIELGVVYNFCSALKTLLPNNPNMTENYVQFLWQAPLRCPRNMTKKCPHNLPTAILPVVIRREDCLNRETHWFRFDYKLSDVTQRRGKARRLRIQCLLTAYMNRSDHHLALGYSFHHCSSLAIHIDCKVKLLLPVTLFTTNSVSVTFSNASLDELSQRISTPSAVNGAL